MTNKDFQELKRQHSVTQNKEERDVIVKEMRDNLIKRNEDRSLYVKRYISPKKEIDISTADITSLYEVDGDMSPLGK